MNDDDWLNIGFTLKYPVSGGAGAGVADGGALSVLGQAGVIWHGVTDQRTQTRRLQSLIIIVSAPVSREHGAPGVVTTLGWAVQLPWDQWWPREAGTHVTTDNNTVYHTTEQLWAVKYNVYIAFILRIINITLFQNEMIAFIYHWTILTIIIEELYYVHFSRYCRVWSAK